VTAAFPTLADLGGALCVGPPGHAYLFGGLTLALALDAAACTAGRPAITGALQFVSFTPLGERLELAAKVLQDGRTVAQAAVTGRIGERLVFQATVALGARPDFVERQWSRPPAVAAPIDCPPCADLPPQDERAGFLASIEVRDAAPAGVEPWRTILWLRRRDGAPIDAPSLAMFADFVPLAVGRATGRAGGGNSLDNALRITGTAPPGWCLCDIIVPAAANGFAQGQVALWDSQGKLLATGSQTLVMKG
jgi:acyl-CoA thioesterase